jgi:hypothetical protein
MPADPRPSGSQFGISTRAGRANVGAVELCNQCIGGHGLESHRDQLHRSHRDAECNDIDDAHHDRLPADRTQNGPKIQ